MKFQILLKQILIVLGLVGVLVLPSFMFVSIAQGGDSMPSASDRLNSVGSGEGRYAQADPTTFSEILGYAVNAFLGLLGIIFIILIIIGGTRYMTASGNEERAKSGLTMIRHAIIGLIIVVGSYAIWTFILQNLLFT